MVNAAIETIFEAIGQDRIGDGPGRPDLASMVPRPAHRDDSGKSKILWTKH